MDPILPQDDLRLYAGWAMIGMAVLQTIDAWLSRGTAQFWKDVRIALLMGGLGASMVFQQDALVGWMPFAVAIVTARIGYYSRTTRSWWPELLSALAWTALGAAVLVNGRVGDGVVYALLGAAALMFVASLVASWRRYRGNLAPLEITAPYVPLEGTAPSVPSSTTSGSRSTPGR